MKKLTLMVFILFLGINTFAQRNIEITPFAGYMFPGTISSEYGDVRFNGNAQYGGMLSFVTRFADIDLLYSREDTKADFQDLYYADYNRLGDLPISINYFQIGSTKHFRATDRVAPFIGANIGGCWMDPKKTFDDIWKFSVGAHLGTKVYLTDRIGLRLQLQALVPIQGAGFVFSIGTGGAGGGVEFSSTLVQIGLNAGLIIRL